MVENLNTLNTVIAFVAIFGALVFFHELGHLIFAKRAGILCREFAIGFGGFCWVGHGAAG